ncbi:MAG: diguanylate cyclase [Phycisphaerales bacterium]|nr:MAG: diguanylate cyclase [Phycisphaerales bacterium]
MEETVERPEKIVAISLDDTVKSAANRMSDNKIGCLIVNDRNGQFAGIVTERDIVTRAVVSSIDLEKTPVTEIMTPQVVLCPLGTPTSKAREIMAANHIRHLPVIDRGVVIGILSARDLMGQQRLEDRAAAEEVAMLSNCLKSIELGEAADTVAREVPKLFHAGRCVLCLWGRPHPWNRIEKRQTKSEDPPAVMSTNRCLCAREQIEHSASGEESDDENRFYDESIPDDCLKAGAKGPRLVIPLSISGLKDAPEHELSGSLCMCGLSDCSVLNRELTSYKAKLTKEILTSHLTNASLYHQARITSLTDALTGVGSRRLLEDKLETECARARRYKRPFSVGIIDLDNFKTINDVLGHAAGDEALKKLAACMKSQKRTPDVLGRYGGDEFVVLMPETKAQDAAVLLERVRTKVWQTPVAESLSMTISCGIAQGLPDQNDSSSEIIRRADLALYEAKSSGRNCVKIWDKTMSKVLKPSDIEFEKIQELKRRIAGLSEQAERMFIQSIWGLVQALEAKDPYAKRHSENVTRYALGVGETIKMPSKQLGVLRRAAMIHDIGKIGIPDAILSKPGKLTPRERNIIEQHPLIAVRILGKMSFLEQEIDIVRGHHEKWNGQGYPEGLSNSSIPLGARILAVADTFDALTSNRSYHNSRSVSEAIEILVDSSGYDFDPKVVDALVSWIREVHNRRGRAEQLALETLLDLEPQLDDDPAAKRVVEACATDD